MARDLEDSHSASDRHDYMPQKRDAFEKLAAHVERIVTANPPRGNVVALADAAPKRKKRGRGLDRPRCCKRSQSICTKAPSRICNNNDRQATR